MSANEGEDTGYTAVGSAVERQQEELHDIMSASLGEDTGYTAVGSAVERQEELHDIMSASLGEVLTGYTAVGSAVERQEELHDIMSASLGEDTGYTAVGSAVERQEELHDIMSASLGEVLTGYTAVGSAVKRQKEACLASICIDSLSVHNSAVGVHVGDRSSNVINNFMIAAGREDDTADLRARLVDMCRQVSSDTDESLQHTQSYLDIVNVAVNNAIKSVLQRVQLQSKWWYLVSALVAISCVICVVSTAVFYIENWLPPVHSSTSGVDSGRDDNSGASHGWLLSALVALSAINLISTALFSINSFRSVRYEAVKPEEIVPGENLSDGPKIMRRSAWLAQTPMGEMDALDLPVKRVVIIHTATEEAFTSMKCIEFTRNIQMFHIEGRKFSDIGYNFLVGGDGCVYEGRGWDKVGAHTKGHNHGSLGIALIGTFVKKLPNEQQLKALKQLLSVGVRIKKISRNYKIVAHFQLTPTDSPGIALAHHLASHWPNFDTSLPFDGCPSY